MTMSRIDAILADPLAGARAADRAIGYVGFDIPFDLLAASGRFACHLPWRVAGECPRADAWLESSFPGWARSIVEDWADGRFDFMEAVVFSRGDDVAQRLYYYLCELQRRGLVGGPQALILDVAKIGREASANRSIEAVRSFAAAWDLSDRDLRRGIEAGNLRRRLFGALSAGRGAGGSLYEHIARASLFAPVEEALAAFEAPRDEPKGRVLLAGSTPPDDRLHRAVEAAGWSVTGEAGDLSLTRLGPEIDPGNDPAAAIGTQSHRLPLGARSFADPAARLLGQAARAGADAVVLWLIEEEEGRVWHVPAQRRALAEAGLPALVMTRRRWDCGDGAGEEIVQFLQGLAA